MNTLEFDVKITANDLYDYMLYHTYHGTQGLIGSCVGAMAILLFLANHQVIYLIAGIVLLVYLPWNLFIKSRQQMLATPAFKKPLHYTLNEEGICVSQDGVTECQKWEDLHKAVATSKSIIVYTSKIHACIFPRREFAAQEQEVIGYISTHMDPKKVNIRR